MHIKHSAKTKIAIVGAGCVGSTTAYTLLLNGVASHIALIDANKDKAEGEMLDLAHCMQFAHTTELSAGNSFELVKDAGIVIICAGFGQKPGETRADLLSKNVKLFKEIIPEITKYNKDCTLLVVTNPLDVLTYMTLKLSGLSPCRVFGTGTVLDTARLRYLTASHFNVSPKDIIAYVLGEHGDSEFVWWSKATIAGVPLSSFDKYYSPEILKQLHEQTKTAVYEIIKRKGATFYAIALVIAKIVRAILLDQSRVFTLSSLHDDICISSPVIVKQNGICQKLALDLNKQEQIMWDTSKNKIKNDIELALKLL